ncbi:MAG: serine protease [Thermoanaerobaculia bacterium]|nr:serine protease [Thermoanaerobaculia bacterium]
MRKLPPTILIILLIATFLFVPASQAQNMIRVADEVRVTYGSPAFGDTALRQGETSLVWRQELHMPGASFITPHFGHFDLPRGARVVVRSPDRTRSWTFTGYGKARSYIEGGFWGLHIYGETAVVELFSKVRVPAGAVVIDAFSHGFPDARWPDAGKSAADEALSKDYWWQRAVGHEKAICGSDDSDWARCYQSSEPAIYNESRAVARLLINGSGACTGWLVGSDGHLMTNEHCITSSSDAANTNYEFLAEGSCSTNCASWGACPGTVVATSASLVKDNATLDYALLELPTNPTGTYGFMQLRAAGATVNERIYIPQHPAHWGKKIGVFSGDSSDGSGFCEVFSLTRPPCSGGSGSDVGYFCDTQGGSSGSPVLGYSDHLVVALHHCANCPNRGVPIQAIISDLQSSGDLPPNALGGGGGGGTCNGSNCIDWDDTPTVSYSNQDGSSQISVLDGGDSVRLTANTWRRTTQTFSITANTVVEFDFSSSSEGEIHGLGFDQDDDLSSDRIFKVHGNQSWGIQDFDNYSGGTVTYSIPVGQYFTGNGMRLVLVNDKDSGALDNNSTFSNVRIVESGGGECAVDDDFESGAAGWSNDGASTCSTGSYVRGNPSQQISTVVTQPAGSASGSNSIFTATNTGVGTDDVDGGNCILSSPGYSVGAPSTLSVNYFHGQRDTGDDAAGDFFNIQYRVDGGSWQTIVSNGDSRSTAAWTNATATVPAGTVEVRVQCSDGSGPGDIVECGIDDLSICEN